jgi:hypothetical protein
MKRILATIAILTFGFLGCHAQVPPQPSVYTCPPAPVGGTAYTPINQPTNNTTAASITGTTYSTTPSSVGTWCYIVQSWAIVSPAAVYQVSPPSNVVTLTTTSTDPQVNLSWTPATSGYTYIVSYAAATLVPPPTAPSLNAPTASARIENPSQKVQLAMTPTSLRLVGQVVKVK